MTKLDTKGASWSRVVTMLVGKWSRQQIAGSLSKGTDLSTLTQDDLDGIADSLNSRRRTTHAFHTPLGVFARMLAQYQQPPSSFH
jgi:IS30 family transposase